MTKCPWCGKEVPIEVWSNHFDSHQDLDYDRKLIRESKNRHMPPPKGLDDPEMVSFARCVAEKLTALPQSGEYPSGPTGYIARLLKRRMEFEREIYDVLFGGKTLRDFFSHATQVWNTDTQKVSHIIYDCLERLQSTESKKVRTQWEKFLRRTWAES